MGVLTKFADKAGQARLPDVTVPAARVASKPDTTPYVALMTAKNKAVGPSIVNKATMLVRMPVAAPTHGPASTPAIIVP